jgi:hypothetical protein
LLVRLLSASFGRQQSRPVGATGMERHRQLPADRHARTYEAIFTAFASVLDVFRPSSILVCG